jgi:hypothetical protein
MEKLLLDREKPRFAQVLGGGLILRGKVTGTGAA